LTVGETYDRLGENPTKVSHVLLGKQEQRLRMLYQ